MQSYCQNRLIVSPIQKNKELQELQPQPEEPYLESKI